MKVDEIEYRNFYGALLVIFCHILDTDIYLIESISTYFKAINGLWDKFEEY